MIKKAERTNWSTSRHVVVLLSSRQLPNKDDFNFTSSGSVIETFSVKFPYKLIIFAIKVSIPLAKVLSCFLPETRSDWETPRDIFSWIDKKSWTIPVHFPNETSQLPERKGPRWLLKVFEGEVWHRKVVVGSCWCLAKGRFSILLHVHI